jgi:hypothetical protein
MGSNKPQSRKDDLVIQSANGEVLVYDLRTNKALCLNETSALIWEECDGTKDSVELRDSVSRKLGSAVGDDLIWLALDQLKKEELLDSSYESEKKFAGMSRREVIKKIGVGSMIALPIVAGLVAPKAIHAQTCIAAGSATGTATLAGNCPSTTQAQKNAACNSQRGSTCCSGTATATTTCSGNPSVFPCVCA